MGRYSIKMPDVGEGITEAEIVEWNVAEGDFVREDDVLGAVMTDKATVEIPSPVTGTVLSLSGELGAMTAVGSEIIALDVEGEGNSSGENDEVEIEVGEAAGGGDIVSSSEAGEEVSEIASPSVVRQATPVHSRPKAVAETVPVAFVPRAVGERPLASPSVRRRAMEAGVRLAYVAGSGPAGRILHADLDSFLEGGQEAHPPAEAKSRAKTGIEEWKVIGLRRKIAERMQDAKARIPHITYVEEVDVTDLEKLRSHMNRNRTEGQAKMTILPFIMRAMVLASAEVPRISAHYDDERNMVRQFEGMHIGMATQTDGGLMVPVIRHAEARGVRELGDEIRRLADGARDGSITREELTGSTITLSSLGAMGGIVSTPVINSPEVAIVGVNKVMVRPVYLDGEFVPRQIMNLSSSFDHRIIDGWDAAVYIQKIKSLLEYPALLFVE